MQEETMGRMRLFFGCAPEADCVGQMLHQAQERFHAGERVVCYYTRDPAPRLERRLRTLARVYYVSAADFKRRGVRVLVILDIAQFCKGSKLEALKAVMDAGVDIYAAVYLTQLSGMRERLAELDNVRGAQVPDELFDGADEVHFVEREARFTDTRAEAARLAFLRDAALRRMAERADRRMQHRHTGVDPFEHVLVCLSPAPSNTRVLRSAARMARALGARFTALYVETQMRMGRAARQRLTENIAYARQLGASVVNVYGADVPLQVAEYAKIARVTKILIGRSYSTSSRMNNTAHRLLEYAPDIEVYIIPDEHTAPRPLSLTVSVPKPQIHFADLAFAIGVLVLCTLIGIVMSRMHLSLMNIAAVYMLGVVAIAWRFSHPVLSVVWVIPAFLSLTSFFDVPYLRGGRISPEAASILIILTTAAFITGVVVDRSNRLAGAAAKNAYNTGVLLSAGQTLSAAQNMTEIARAAMRSVQNLLGCAMLFCYKNADGAYVFETMDEDERPIAEERLGFTEYGAAKYAFENREPAGCGTQNFRYAKARYVPLADDEGVNAVIGMFSDMQIGGTDTSLLDSLFLQISLTLERYQTDKKREQAMIAAENEMLRANLLRAISHDLRTPLTGILGSAGLLMSPLAPRVRDELVQDIYQDAQWLVNLVENVLSVTRMEGGKLALKLTPQILDEIIDEAMTHVAGKSEHPVQRESDGSLLIVRADAQLMTQVLVNLVNNAFGHGGESVHVCVRAYRDGADAVIEVRDDGVGIPDEAKGKVFDLFYTSSEGAGDSRKGLGVGLALCKSIVSAHHGQISVSDAQPHGAVFTIRLAAIDVEGQEENHNECESVGS